MEHRINRFNTAVLVCIMLLASGIANAKDTFDGSSNLVCAAINVIGCIDGTTCKRGEARTFDLPEFMTIDFKKKIVHASYDSGANEAESPIKNFEKTGTQLVLQGIENGHGWSMAIHRDNGRMSLAVVGEEVSYSMYGACKAL